MTTTKPSYVTVCSAPRLDALRHVNPIDVTITDGDSGNQVALSLADLTMVVQYAYDHHGIVATY